MKSYVTQYKFVVYLLQFYRTIEPLNWWNSMDVSLDNFNGDGWMIWRMTVEQYTGPQTTQCIALPSSFEFQQIDGSRTDNFTPHSMMKSSSQMDDGRAIHWVANNPVYCSTIVVKFQQFDRKNHPAKHIQILLKSSNHPAKHQKNETNPSWWWQIASFGQWSLSYLWFTFQTAMLSSNNSWYKSLDFNRKEWCAGTSMFCVNLSLLRCTDCITPQHSTKLAPGMVWLAGTVTNETWFNLPAWLSFVSEDIQWMIFDSTIIKNLYSIWP